MASARCCARFVINPASRAYRDFRLGSIGGGADEVMLQVIAKQMGLMSRG